MALWRKPRFQTSSPLRVTGSKNALTASGYKVRNAEADTMRRLVQPWQMRSFAYYDRVPEIKYAASFYSRALSVLRLYAGLKDAGGDIEEIEDQNNEAVLALERIQDPGGGRSGLLAAYGRLQFLIGESLLFVSRDPETDREQWEMLSPDELRITQAGYTRYKAPSVMAENFRPAADEDWEPIDDDTAVAYRLWRRHPRYCVDEETEILTEQGWRHHNEVAPGVRVLTLNHDSGESEWQPVQAVNRFDVEDEEMVSVEGAAHSSLTTLEHRWPTLHKGRQPNRLERYWTTSEALNSNDHFITAAACADLPSEETFSDDFVEAVAWFYTEGSIARRYRSAQVSLCQSASANPEGVERIRSALTGMYGRATEGRMSTGSGPLAPPKWREYREPNRPTVYFWLNTAASAELLAVAPDKVVSLDFVRALTRRQLDIFIDVSIAADGGPIGHGSFLLAQKDRRRLAAFELACILAGRTTYLREGTYELQTKTEKYRMWSLRSSPKTTWHIEASSRRMGPRGLNSVPTRRRYTGTVWCPTTRNQSWLARRNGTVYYTGNSLLADSTMQGVLDVCEELVLLTQAVRSRARSRLAGAGILIVNGKISPVSLDADADDENPDDDPFIADLTEAMTQPIVDEGAASAVVPLVVRTDLDDIDKAMKLIQIVDPTQVYPETGLRYECVKRLAIGLDMPPEVLLGMEDSNHWCVDDETEILTDEGWKSHDALDVGDTVLTLNHETGLSEWKPVDDVARFEVEDLPMLSIESRYHSSLTTLNHRWPVLRLTGRAKSWERAWTYSDEIRPTHRLVTAAPSRDALTPQWVKHDDALVELVAWLWTEGSIRERPGRLSPQVRIYQSHAANPENVLRIRAALTSLYGAAVTVPMRGGRGAAIEQQPRWREVRSGEKTTFVLNTAAAEAALAYVGPDRIVSTDFIRTLTASQLALFIETSTRADGSTIRSGCQVIGQKDAARLAPLELAAILLGRSPSSYSQTHEGFTTHEQHYVSVSDRQTVRLKKTHLREARYTGTIWCPVTENSTWLARRNGRVFYTGNSAWQVDENTWKAHLQPVAQQLVDDLTSSYFQPMLQELGVSNWQDYVVAYDATAIINHPDRTKDAKDLYDRNAIGKAALRDASGFDDEDAPNQDEWNEYVGVKVRDSSLAVYGIPQIRGTGGLEPEAGEIEQGDPGATVDPGTASSEAKKAPPPPPTETANEKPGNVTSAAFSARVLGASDLALLRTREIAGNRLRNLAKRDAEAAALIDGVRASLVASVLGRERALALGAPPEGELVKGAEDLLADALRLWGIEGKVALRLGQLLAQHAAKTLYDAHPPSLPPAFVNYIAGLGGPE